MGQIYRIQTAFTGPNIGLLPVIPDAMPVSGASRRWEAATISGIDGAEVASWSDIVGGTTLSANTGTPALATVDGLKTVRFTNDILQQSYNLGQPHTVAVAFKHVTLNTSATATVFGAQSVIGSDGGIFQTTTVGDFYANAGTAFKVGSAAATTGWKRLVVTFNGASSVVRLNGTEYAGDMGALGRVLFSLGGQRGGQFTDIAVTHASIFPKALTTQERADLDTWLTGKVA